MEVQTFARDLMTVYFTQGLTLLAVLYLIFSGGIKKIINKFMSVRKVRAGNVEIEADGCPCPETERRKAYRRSTNGACAEHAKLAQTVEGVGKRLEKLEEHSEETWIGQLRNTFYNENPKMPLSDKLYAGLRYVWWGTQVENGPNGQMKSDVLSVALNNKDSYQAITKLRPELKLEEIEKNTAGPWGGPDKKQ